MCDRQRAIKSTAMSGYFTSALAEEHGAGSSLCLWTIEAQPGQRINVTLLSFVELASDAAAAAADSPGPEDGGGQGRRPPPGYGPLRPDVCFEIAVLTDVGGDRRKPVTVCGDEEREVPLLWSESHVVTIEMSNPKLVQSLGTFVFHYQGSEYNSVSGIFIIHDIVRSERPSLCRYALALSCDMTQNSSTFTNSL